MAGERRRVLYSHSRMETKQDTCVYSKTRRSFRESSELALTSEICGTLSRDGVRGTVCLFAHPHGFVCVSSFKDVW